MRTATRGHRVHCVGCGLKTERLRREDGTYGPCRCGASAFRRMTLLQDKRMAKARLDIAGYTSAIGGTRG